MWPIALIKRPQHQHTVQIIFKQANQSLSPIEKELSLIQARTVLLLNTPGKYQDEGILKLLIISQGIRKSQASPYHKSTHA